MKTKASLVKLIVFMVVTSFLTYTLAATIGSFSFGAKTTYKAVFTDVTGLLPGNEVRMAGVKVGSVAGLELKGTTALVSFSLDQGRTLTSSDIIRLRFRNLVGERYLAVTPGPGAGAPMSNDTTIPKDHTRDALDLTVLFNGFKPLFQALDPQTTNQVAEELIQVLQGEGGTVQSLLQRTASLTNTLADKDAVIGRVINNLGTVLATVDDRDTQVNDLITQLQRLSKGFADDRQAIGGALGGINALTTATADLLKQTRAPLRADIAQLATLAGTLDDQKGVVDGVLSRLPDKLDRIVNTATYGSFFNFYLCGINGKVTVPNPVGGSIVVPIPSAVNDAPRCKTEVSQ